MTELKGKTLAELNVQPGDVVLYDGSNGGNVSIYTVAGQKGGECYSTEQEFGGCTFMNSKPACWHLIHRAKPSRDQLTAQIAELIAQRDAMPVDVRVMWWPGDRSSMGYSRDFPLIDGVPEGFVEVTK